jgi:hypothetical protein
MKTEINPRTFKMPFTRQSRRVFFCMKTFFLLLAGLTAFASASFAQNVTVVGSTGADGSYATLNAAFTAINANTTQTGNTIAVTITGDTSEPASAVLNQPSGGSWTTLTISTSGTFTISGAIAGALIDLNGADNVTINGTGGLTIDNSSATATASTIRFIADATNNTVQNCNIKGSGTVATLGTIFFSTGTTTGNDGNIINSNNITSSGANLPVNGIYSLGTSAAIDNSGNTISGNNISDYFGATLVSIGINLAATGNSAWTITNNKLFQTATRIFTTANTHNGIFVGVGSGYTITGNTIGFANASGTGTTNIVGNSVALTGTFPTSYTTTGTANATRYVAINAAFTAGGAVSNIQNNTIAGFATYSSSGATTLNGVWCGINVTSGNANIGTTTANTIGATSGSGGAGTGSIYLANTVSGGVAVGIYATSANTVAIQNNTIGALDSVGTTATSAGAFNGIDTAGTGVFTINSNVIGNTTADNIRTGYTLSGGNLSNAGTLTSTTGSGTSVFLRGATTGATLSLNTNTLRGFATSSTAQAVTGITSTGANTSSVTINTNSLGTAGLGWLRYAFANSGALAGIILSGSTAATTHSIQTNDFQGIVYAVASTGTHTYINNTAGTGAGDTSTIASNTFTNLNVNTTGSVTFISQSYTASSTGTKNTNSNSIVTAFNKPGAGGTVTFIVDNGSSVTGAISNCQSNNFSNGTLTGATAITGISYTDGGTAPTRTVTGNTINNWTTGAATVNCMNFTYWNGASSLSTNTVTNITGQAAITGLTIGASVNTANPANVSSNTISNLSSTGTGGAVTGITCSNTSTVFNISSNTINTLSSTGASAVSGIVVSAAGITTGTTVSKNKICDLSGTNASTTVNGILVSSASTSGLVTLVNNLVGNLTASAATGSNAINGINITGSATTATFKVYYNTVSVSNPSSGAGFGSSGISTVASATSTTSTLDLRNNIIVNTSVQNGAGLTVAYRRSLGTAGTLANYASTSNNNDFYAGTPSATNLIYSDGTSTAQTMAAYKSGAFTAGTIAPRDSASFTENPPFLSTTCGNANFLHINTGIATQIESGATPIAGLTTDFDGDTRNATTPDVGADEFAGTLLDLTPPNISYTALGNTNLTGARTLTATITDPSGVPTSGIGLPVLYWKINAGSYTAATSTFIGSNQYQFSFGSGVVTGDVVSYYVVAQDGAATPNVGSNPSAGASGFTANPPAASTPPTTPNSYSILASISGTFNVGIGQTYTTLTAAVADINGKVLNGPVVLNLTDSSYTTGPGQEPKGPGETFPITINANGGSSAANTITIKPASGVTAAITNSSASSIIKLNGASWVIVDGSNNGTSSRDLTITNSSTAATTAVVWLASAGTGQGSTNNTIKNSNILAGSSSVASTYGIALSGTTIGTAGADNDNNTIQNNTISTVYYGIYANGTAAVSAGADDGLAITNNLIGPAVSGATNTGFAGVWLQNALTATISGNTVRNLTTTVASAGGIYLNSNVNGATISQNTITNITSTATSSGTASITALYLGNSVFNTTVSRNTITTVASTTSGGYGVRAVIVNTGFSGSNDTIVNNMISDVYNFQDATVTLYATIGIDIDASGGINVYDNSINLFGDHPGYASNTTGGVSAALYINTTGTGLDIRDNILSNSYNNTTSTGDKSYAIYSLSANTVFSAIDYNLYYVAGNGTPVLGFISSTDQATVAAIQASFGGNTHSVSGNPQFNSATDLHINPSIATLVESGGTPIAGITIDIDGDTRNATTPDIGADEGNFTLVVTNDMQATAFIDPVNGGSKLAGTSFSPQASFTNNGSATQTNVTVRYRICTDGTCATTLYNQTNSIASIANGVTTTVTFPSTSLSAGTYTIKAKAELAGDQVPGNDEITGTFTVQNPLSGNYSVGSTGNFQTITAAVNALNNLGVSGPVVMTLLDTSNTTAPQNTGEVFPITINAIPGASSTNTIIMKPANPSTTITGSSASALFILNGTSYITIDGSSNGTSSRDLTMTNNNASAAGVIWLKSSGTGLGATNNTIKNTNIVGGSVTTTYGIALSGGTIGTAGADNDSNTIRNNSISNVFYGIYANGTSATSTGGDDSLNIDLNVIGPAVSGANNTGFAGIWVGNSVFMSMGGNTVRNLTATASNAGGIRLDSNVNGAAVSQNTVTNINSSAAASGTAGITGIYLGNAVINSTVSRNAITTVVSTTTSGYTARGIMVNSGIAASNDTIVNNFITDVYCFEDASNIYWPIGIALEGASGGINIFANSVNLFGSHPGYSSNTTGGAAPAMFNNSTGSSIDIRDNVFTSSYENTTSTGDKAYAIYSVAAASAYSNIDYNDYYTSGPGIPVLGFLGTDQTTIAAWRVATGKDANSKNVDPLFVSATDLHLQLSSTLLGMGISIGGVTTDIDGDLRQSPPDIGADELITYTLTYTAGANGTISGTSPQTVLSGGSGTAVTAVPNTGYHFVNWSDSSTANPRTDTNVTADISVTANFAINTYTLTYTAGANGTISGTSPQTVNYGASGTPVTAVPNTGYHFVNWSDSSTQNPRTDTNVTADISVTANFAINTYTLTYTAGANGAISGTSPQTVNYGGSGTPVTAVPNTGYHFVNWSDASTANPRTDTNVMADISVTANFAINTYTLTYTAGPNGSISGTSPQTVNYGDSGTPVTAVPNTGYHFVNWSDASTSNPRTDTNVMADVNVTANFALTGPVTVSGSTGANGDYPSLTQVGGAFAAINAAGSQAGNNILVTIISDVLTEDGANSLNNGGWTTLTVSPAGTRTLSGSVAGPLINLNGANNVTITGSGVADNVTVAPPLTISNTNTGATASTIQFINAASNNTVTNCSVLGSSTGAVAAASGTILFSTSTGGANTGNTISNNNIGPAGVNLPTKAVMSLGSASPNNNTLNVVTNNNIFDFFNATTSVSGISVQSNNDNWTISNNRLYQTAPRVFTGTVLRYAGITLNNTGAFTVTGNTIGFGAADGTGTTTISGSTNTVRGIDAASTSTTVATSIQGNTISGINQTTASTGTGTSTGFIAMMLGSTDGLFNVGNVTGNNIGSLNGSSTIVVNSSAGTGIVYGIFNFSLGGTNISNNNIGSITIQGTGITNGFRGILVNTASAATALATINNNTVANITDTQVGSYGLYAIQVALPPVSMTGNVTRNLTGNSNGGVVVMSGIVVSNASSTIPSTISQNTVHSLSDTVTGGASGAVYAMDLTLSTNAGNLVERNLVHSVNVTSTFTTYQIFGIIARTQGVATYKNNMIRLGLDAAGNSITTGFSFIGIRDSGGTTSANNYYHNSVYIGGTGVVSGSNTYCILSDVVTNTRNFVDNIFWNARSNGTGTIGNVAIRVGGTAPNPAGLTSNYNILYASGNNGVTGVFNGFIIPTLADWRAATGQDANSIAGNPRFIAPNGTAATVDLHIHPTNGTPIESAGILVASVTNDFDGETRASLTPTDIGADAGNFVANTPPTISAAAGVTRQQGSPVSNSTIATVNDTESGAGAVVVTVTSANPSNGVTISNIANTAGTVTADVVASCIATNTTFTLQASDGTSTNTAILTVTVTVNTAPTLTYNNAAVANGGSTTVNPATGPSDNGSVSTIVVQSTGTYTGTISVDIAGVVSVSNAAPIGSHTITIRATDNCGATTDATFTLNVTNNNPSITAGAPVTRQKGSAGTTAMIATVSDPDQSAGSLTVTATTVPAGISVTDITNTNGTVTATVAADCSAAVGANTVVLTVTDSNSGTATANFTVNVTANTAPTLTYNNAAVAYNGSTSVNPATGPTDNGTVSTIVVQSQGTYTGTISVDNVTGVVSISNATPNGSHTITIRATDNCGAITDATFTLTVAAHVAPVVTNTNDSGVNSLRQALLDVLDGETITFNIPPTDPGYVAGVWTISLTTGELVVDKDVTINGLGANVLVVRRDPSASNFRVFHVTSGLSRPGDAPSGIPAGVTIQGLTISGGVSNSGLFGGAGGGIYNDHTNLTVNACALSGNSAVYGGAIISDGLNGTASLAITNSTLSGNSASGDSLASGGGVMNYGYNGSVPLNVANSTFSQNSASSRGGGIFNYGETGSAPLNIANSTFSQNSSTNGGGAIFNSFGATTIGNSILKTGVSGPNIDGGGGSITSSGYNLSNDNGGGFLTATGDQINTDPILGPLKNNGGPTFTHAPLSNSPAIDRGKDIGPTGQDQRGSVRPVTYDVSIVPPSGGDRSDIGAVELPPGVQPTSAVSRKTHGAAGDFNITLPLTGPVGIECRSGGANNDYRVVFTFAAPVTYGSAVVSNGVGTVGGSSGSGTNTITVDLTGVTDVQRITVALLGADDGTNTGDVGIRMGVLIGDTTGDSSVNAGDVSQTKSESGHVVSSGNFRTDVNANGAINVGDVAMVKSKSGNVLLPPFGAGDAPIEGRQRPQ